MKRPYTAVGIAVFLALGLSACTPAPPPPSPPEVAANDIAMTVEGTPVHADEFRYCVTQVRASVLDTASKRGWVVDEAAPVPDNPVGELFVDQGAARCIDGVIRRHGAVALDVIDDASFASLVDRWNADNEARRAAADAGEVLYGPVEKSLAQYEFQEMSDAASAQEKADAVALTGDPVALDEAVRARPEVAEGLDMSVAEDRMIAAQILARETFESTHAGAIADAEVTMNDAWVSLLTISDLMEP